MLKRAFAFILIVFNMTSSKELCKRYCVKFDVYVEKAACGEEIVHPHEIHGGQCAEYCDLNPKVLDIKSRHQYIPYELLIPLLVVGRAISVVNLEFLKLEGAPTPKKGSTSWYLTNFF